VSRREKKAKEELKKNVPLGAKARAKLKPKEPKWKALLLDVTTNVCSEKIDLAIEKAFGSPPSLQLKRDITSVVKHYLALVRQEIFGGKKK